MLLAHEDREALLAADVQISYHPALPVYDPAASPVTFKTITIEKGRLDDGFAAADVIVEGEYRAGHQEQLYIEPNGVIAVPETAAASRCTDRCSVRTTCTRRSRCCSGFPDDKVRVIQTETGGGFGGKEEYPSMIAGHAALLALKARRPVKLIYDRVEDMLATTKRHPAIVRHRTGVTRDGRLTAIEVDAVLDGGAYATLSAVVLSRGVIHASGPYRCDHIRIHGRAAMTNTPPNGAFRGFGAPQTQFAAEVHMDRIAERARLDPVRLREINALRPGDTTATGQRLGGLRARCTVLREAVKRTDFKRRRRALGRHQSGHRPVAVLSRVRIHRRRRGEARVEGVAGPDRARRADLRRQHRDRSGHAHDARADRRRHAGHALRLHRRECRRHGEVPDSGPTVASRTCMVVGRILQRCAEEMRTRLGRLTPREYLRTHGPLVITKEYERPGGMSWDDASYQGDAYGSYGWGCDVVELEVDRDTWEVKPIAFTSVHEIGKAIHPMLALGQIEGGSAQGLGYALLEEVVMRDGRMANASLTNYIIPTTLDTPTDGHRHAGESVQARPVRRERRRRDADRRPGAGGHQRAAARRLRSARDSGDAREDHDGLQERTKTRKHEAETTNHRDTENVERRATNPRKGRPPFGVKARATGVGRIREPVNGASVRGSSDRLR